MRCLMLGLMLTLMSTGCATSDATHGEACTDDYIAEALAEVECPVVASESFAAVALAPDGSALVFSCVIAWIQDGEQFEFPLRTSRMDEKGL